VSTGPDDEQTEEPDLIALLARSYGVAADLYSVLDAVSERVVHNPTQEERSATGMVLGGLLRKRGPLRKPGNLARWLRGEDPFGYDRKGMIMMVWAWRPRPSPAEFVDGVLEEVSSTLLRNSAEA
jgi:hypothetical protein